jgi:chromate transporter
MEREDVMDWTQLGGLFLYFLMLSFLAIGGNASVLPEMHRYVVEVHGYMTSAQFAEMYTLAQVAPGPNIMYIPLVGWHIAGWLAAAVMMVATLLPSATLTLAIAHLYVRHPKAAFGIAIRRGLTPITIGLVFASGWILLPAVSQDWRGYALAALTVAVVMRTSLNPLWVLAAGAAAGMAGLV